MALRGILRIMGDELPPGCPECAMSARREWRRDLVLLDALVLLGARNSGVLLNLSMLITGT